MRISEKVERGRVRGGLYASEPGGNFGAFKLFTAAGRELFIIASPGDVSLGVDWEHVSVSLSNRCPTWEEMCWVKSLFWDEEETVMQLHPPRSRWINNHPYCLHLWRPTNQEIPLPPENTIQFWRTPRGKLIPLDLETLAPHWKSCPEASRFRTPRLELKK